MSLKQPDTSKQITFACEKYLVFLFSTFISLYSSLGTEFWVIMVVTCVFIFKFYTKNGRTVSQDTNQIISNRDINTNINSERNPCSVHKHVNILQK